MKTILAIVVGVILIGSVAIPQVYSTNTTGWNSSVVTVFTVVVPIVCAIFLVLLVLPA